MKKIILTAVAIMVMATGAFAEVKESDEKVYTEKYAWMKDAFGSDAPKMEAAFIAMDKAREAKKSDEEVTGKIINGKTKFRGVLKRITTKSDGTVINSEESTLCIMKTIPEKPLTFSEEKDVCNTGTKLTTREEHIKSADGKVIKSVTRIKIITDGLKSKGESTTTYDNGKVESTSWVEEIGIKRERVSTN